MRPFLDECVIVCDSAMATILYSKRVFINRCFNIGGQAIGGPTSFHIGVQTNPGAEDLDGKVRCFEYEVEASAEFAMTNTGLRLGDVRAVP